MGLVYLHGAARGQLAAAGTRIGREELVRLQGIDALLREAEATAASMVAVAGERAEAVRRSAFDDGQRQGREAALVAILGTLEVERRMIELLADRIGGVVEQCVRSLIGQVGATELFARRIQHAVRSLTPDGRATLHVAPAQAHLAQEAIALLAEQSGTDLRWVAIHLDEHCQPDEFVIETDIGFVDARLSTTLQGARRIIEQAIRRAGEQLPQPARPPTP